MKFHNLDVLPVWFVYKLETTQIELTDPKGPEKFTTIAHLIKQPWKLNLKAACFWLC